MSLQHLPEFLLNRELVDTRSELRDDRKELKDIDEQLEQLKHKRKYLESIIPKLEARLNQLLQELDRRENRFGGLYTRDRS